MSLRHSQESKLYHARFEENMLLPAEDFAKKEVVIPTPLPEMALLSTGNRKFCNNS